MTETRRMAPESDTLEDIVPGDYIYFPKEHKFRHLTFDYLLISEEAFYMLKPIAKVSKTEWSWNKLLTVFTNVCEESERAHALYKHDHLHYLVTIR